MNGPKRLQTVPKSSTGEGMGKYIGKQRDTYTAPRQKPEGKLFETDTTNIPIIKQSDNARLLPKYTVVAKLVDDGISMDDLDQLQQDLEKLLSASAIRIRYLLAEIGEINRNDDTHERKAHEKTSLKRKRPDEKPKFKDLKNRMKVMRKSYGLPVNKFTGESHVQQEIPKVTLPKNDNSDKFWASIEPFCANITKDDIAFLDSLIQEFSKEIDTKIPEIGEHYANSWTEEIINEEYNLGKSPSKKPSTITDLKKNDINGMVESFSTPQTQKLLGSLLEDRILNAIPKNGDNGIKSANLKITDMSKTKTTTNQKIGLCLDRRLKKELVDQGILSAEDITKDTPEDEILKELKKCQEELITVNNHNIEELKKFKTVACNELHSNELKEQLEKVDKQVLELYSKIIIIRKKVQQEEGEEFDKAVFTEQIAKEFEPKADALLKQQIELNREINGLIDIQTSY